MAARDCLALLLLAFAAQPGRAETPRTIVFAAYNLENYFQPADFPDRAEPLSKSSRSIEAEIRVIHDISPDILGVCEMGPPNELDAFRTRLKAAGLDYPEVEFVAGPDPERHVALLSRFPIASRQSLPDVSFQLDGREEKVRRGFLDVTIALGPEKIRFIGVHLKSKLRDTREDEALLRREEAHLLRQHIDQAVAESGSLAGVVVYGDFNDTKNEPAMKEIIGSRRSDAPVRDLWLRDSAGDTWTEYWKTADVYSRIDYILVSREFYKAVDFAGSYIYRSAYWEEASDHRPVVATFRISP